ncbi:hypothetical protein L596_026842 [Steinernema carpocapsae]|uniref:Uncharacterized protein n=1 Tax=Steinernema carpocapsae TaxID=34508 RepID=A0A4U5M2L9_STECR|nr:hypothetical protein L596_026842 [Steinernema carpocapsae]
MALLPEMPPLSFLRIFYDSPINFFMHFPVSTFQTYPRLHPRFMRQRSLSLCPPVSFSAPKIVNNPFF